MMTLNDGVAWGTIIGGAAGLLSLVWIIFDKVTTRPKIITSVRKAIFRNEGLEPFSGKPRVYFKVSLEIGNVGSEATTVTRIHLKLMSGQMLDAKDHQSIGGRFRFIVDDHNTRICEKGIAFVEDLTFYANNMTSSEKQIQGTIELTLIGGGKHKQIVTFEPDT